MLRDAVPLLRQLHEVNFNELTQVIVMWMQQLNPSGSRRELPSKLSAAFTLAAGTPLFDMLNPDEHKHVTRVIHHPKNFDLQLLFTSSV